MGRHWKSGRKLIKQGDNSRKDDCRDQDVVSEALGGQNLRRHLFSGADPTTCISPMRFSLKSEF